MRQDFTKYVAEDLLCSWVWVEMDMELQCALESLLRDFGDPVRETSCWDLEQCSGGIAAYVAVFEVGMVVDSSNYVDSVT